MHNAIIYILNVFFCSNKISHKDIKKNHIRDIIFALVIFDLITSIILLFLDNKLIVKYVVLRGIISIIYLYTISFIYALVLYIIDKLFIKKIEIFRLCIKVIIPILIVDSIMAFLQAVMCLLGIQFSDIIQSVTVVLINIYGIILLSYFLKNFFNYKKRDIIIADTIFMVLLMLPTIVNILN